MSLASSLKPFALYVGGRAVLCIVYLGSGLTPFPPLTRRSAAREKIVFMEKLLTVSEAVVQMEQGEQGFFGFGGGLRRQLALACAVLHGRNQQESKSSPPHQSQWATTFTFSRTLRTACSR